MAPFKNNKNKIYCETYTKEDTNTTISTIEKEDSNIPKWWSFLIGNIYDNDNDPYEFTTLRKNVILFIISSINITGPLGSMIYLPCLNSITTYFNTTDSLVNASISSFMIAMGIAPLIWASLSENYGRKRMYIYSNLINIVFSILCANASSIWMLIIFRGFQSCGANAGQTLGAGVIADMININKRGNAYGLFHVGALLSNIIGPVVGGFLSQYYGWQSIFYFLASIAIVQFVMVICFLPETLRKNKPNDDDIIESDTIHLSKHYRTQKGKFKNFISSFYPVILLLQDPTILIITLYGTIITATTYLLNPTITKTFQSLYGFEELQVGLCFLAFGIGLMLGSVFSGYYSDYIYEKLQSTTVDKISPESRLKATIPSFFFIPIGLLVYGWTIEKHLHYIFPLIGLFTFALGHTGAFTPTSVYLVDSKPGMSATAVGISIALRCIMASITTYYSSQILNYLSFSILYSILASINLFNCLFIPICMKYGSTWRNRFDQSSKSIRN
ncbi:major facilitator superfamily domain-containing protein [Cunninghamella echinulata]|nr:major facilitator superfamily domain-containing protein [Cunninghamella echinulata]